MGELAHLPPFEFVLPKLTPSLNVATRRHWSGGHKEVAEWQQWLAVARGQVQRWERPGWDHALLTITRRSHQPITDEDNLLGGVKYLVDALVRDGYIKDDSKKVLYRVVVQEKVPRAAACTVVRIEPL